MVLCLVELGILRLWPLDLDRVRMNYGSSLTLSRGLRRPGEVSASVYRCGCFTDDLSWCQMVLAGVELSASRRQGRQM